MQIAVSHEESHSLTIVDVIIGHLNSTRIIVGAIRGNVVGITDIVQEGMIAVPIGVDTGWLAKPSIHVSFVSIKLATTVHLWCSGGAPVVRQRCDRGVTAPS